MTSLQRAKNGAWVARKGLPVDVRPDFKHLYGQGHEVKLRLPAGVAPDAAKARFADWLAEVEGRIANIRAARSGEAQSLSERQARALAGR